LQTTTAKSIRRIPDETRTVNSILVLPLAASGENSGGDRGVKFMTRSQGDNFPAHMPLAFSEPPKAAGAPFLQVSH
jgi:hypothetical protein